MTATTKTTNTGITTRRLVGALAASLTLTVGLVGCAAAEPASAPSGSTQAAEGHGGSDHSHTLTVIDPWVKATDGDMTAVFATFENPNSHAVTVVSATVEGAEMTELHETIVQSDGSSVMQPIDGGFTIETGEQLVLEPGGNHIMPMGLESAIEPGDEVAVTLTLDDGSEVEFAAIAKEYTGAEETYAPDTEHGAHDEGDESEHEGH
ncbi:copper chaperone PCu(A)C [Gulosibacter faecalis]|uniref:Copper chaperone PCu(A)C n=1 Tax=Gulosibacter faecalis TaxID=272240 RepID=A0ABW5UV71_9MICO|nr:copper chaperone PCu(A)C [Gulosibacter faecalis]